MWEVLQKLPRGRLSLRNLPLLATTAMLALFLVLGIPLETAYAADDAQRAGSNVSYGGHTYARIDKSASPDQLPSKVSSYDGYVYFDSANQKAYYLLTSGPADKATSAEYTVFDMPTIGSYGNNSPPSTVSIVDISANAAQATQTGTGTSCDSTQTGGLGWILCPVVGFIANGMDKIYSIVARFLEVRTVTADTTSSLYRMWAIVRDIANICFVGVFLVIIYSQITGMGYTNYNLKKMLPRLIAGAVLVNISFWLCAVAVDASNLIGYSIHDLFMTVMQNLNTEGQYQGAASYSIPTWAGIAGAVLAGSGAAVGLAIAIDTGAIFVLVPALVGAILAALIALVILAARQALIICLIIISPLAFVAFLLPNTEKWFDKWRQGFLTLLFLFPIFSVLFSGAQLAGMAIVQSAGGNIITIILGMTVQVAPLFITPMIMKFSGGLLGRIGGIVNNPNRGLIDRSRNWANGEREHRRRQYQTRTDRHFGRDPLSWNHRAVSRSLNRRRRRRALQDKENDSLLEGRAESDYHQRVFNATSRNYRHQQQKNTRAHEHHATGKIYKERMESADEEHWQNHLYGPSAHGTHLRNLNTASHVARGRAGVSEEAMKAANELALQNSINTDPVMHARKVQGVVDSGTAKLTADSIDATAQLTLQNAIRTNAALSNLQRDMRTTQATTKIVEESMQAADDRHIQHHISSTTALRDMKIQTTINAGVAKHISDNIDAHGKLGLQNEIYGDRALRQLKVDTHEQAKRAEVVEGLLQSRADVHWGHLQIRDAGIKQQLHEATRNKSVAKVMEDSLTAQHQRAAETHIDQNASLKAMKIQSVRDNEVSKLIASDAESAGHLAAQQEISSSPNLQTIHRSTHSQNKKAERIKGISDNDAENEWNEQNLTNATSQEEEIRLRISTDRSSRSKAMVDATYAELKKGDGSVLNPSIASTVRDSLAADAYAIAEEASLTNIRAAQAASELKSKVNNELLTNATTYQLDASGNKMLDPSGKPIILSQRTIDGKSLQEYAAGIGKQGNILASAIAEDRADWGKQAQAAGELIAHFKLESGQVQKLARFGSGTKVKATDDHGNEYEFDAGDEYVKEAAISKQYKEGSYGQKMQILMETGEEVEDVDAAGNKIIRKGYNFAHRSTVKSDAVASGIARLAPFINDVTYNEILKGNFNGEDSIKMHALRQIFEGRIKADNLAGANNEALDILTSIGELRNSSNPADQDQFNHYKDLMFNLFADMYGVGSTKYAELAANFDTQFDSNYAETIATYQQILNNSNLSRETSLTSRQSMEKALTDNGYTYNTTKRQWEK